MFLIDSKNVKRKKSITCSKCGSKNEKIFKLESIKILKILDLINDIERYQKQDD